MGIRDNDIERARQRMYIPVWQFSGWVESTGVLGSAGVGAGVPAELATTGLVGLPVDADDEISHIMEFPSFWDIAEEIGVRVRWCAVAHNSAADSMEWLFNYGTWPDGTAIAAPAATLNTALVAQTIGSTTTLTHKRTARGVINRNTFSEANLDGLFGFMITAADIGTFTADEARLLGVTFDYMPAYAVGVQNGTSISRQ